MRGVFLLNRESVVLFPYRSYLEVEISLSQDQIGKYADKCLLYVNTCMKELRRLFLVQDLVDSLKVSLRMTFTPPTPHSCHVISNGRAALTCSRRLMPSGQISDAGTHTLWGRAGGRVG